MVDKELTGKIKELKELKLMAEELEAQITSIEDEVKAELTARNVEELILGVFKIKWTRYTSTRFDSAAFKAAHKDIYDLFAKPIEARRFTIA
jgi:predicted phage-related endonuclease